MRNRFGTSKTTVVAKIVDKIADIKAAHWDACAGGGNPFVRHAFLKALEDSGCVGRGTGWAPYHLVIEDEQAGGLLGAVPMYLKGHSQGEFIFDYGWADAYERAGGQYYPKLLAAVPFTPATGPRLLVRSDVDATATRQHLLAGCVAAAKELGVSSLHINYPTEPEWRLMGEQGLLQRTGEQFHWFNQGYRTFDDFLAALSSRKRKTVRRERREALTDGIEIIVKSGAELGEADWDAFYRFYMDTGGRKWGRPYLNREFYSLLGAAMPEAVALVICLRDGRPIAGALNLIGDDTLFGRYWGCIEDHRFLHFEACYYQAIEYAIDHGLQKVEAGAQGPHKLARGYVPAHIYSAHWIRDRGFHQAVDRFLEMERREVDDDIDRLARYAPYRQGDPRTEEQE